MDMGTRGVWYAADKLSPGAWTTFARRIEALGYGALWYSESRGFESMALASFLLCQTEKLVVGSSIANIYARDAMVAWGDVPALEGRIAEHVDAGATHVCIQPVHAPGDLAAALRVLEALAP